MNKAEVLAAMRTGRAEWEALLAEVGAERMGVPGVEGIWSVRDVVAHITAYERWTAAQLAAAARGEEASPLALFGRESGPPETIGDDTDAYNAWVVEGERERPLADVLDDGRRAHEQLLATVEALPDEVTTDPQHFAWLGGRTVLEILPNQSFNHYHMHSPAIRAWLDRQRG